MKLVYYLFVLLAIVTEESISEYVGCNDTQDLEIFKAEWETLHGKVDKCATRCLGRYNCANACVKKELGLTNECSACFANNIVCGASKCMAECLVDHYSEKCMKCYEKYCHPVLLNCTNVDPSVLPP